MATPLLLGVAVPSTVVPSRKVTVPEVGAVVTDVVAYRTVLEDTRREGDPDIYRMLLDGQIDAVTFTSASTVEQFHARFDLPRARYLLLPGVRA